jgi:hypothetical protein
VILAKPNQRLLSSLSALDGDPNFEVVKEWLTVSLQELNVANASTKDKVLTRWNQGSIQTLYEVLETSKNARQALSRLK